jgi:type I restriction enzyme S subunit
MASYPRLLLRDICDAVEYGYTASSSTAPIGPRFLRITDIVPDRLDWDGVPFCAIDQKKLAKHRLRNGDIVIARTGATTGWAKYIANPPEAVFASYLVRIQPSESVDSRYVGFVVESQVYKDFIQQHMGGAAQPNANAQVLTSFELPLPPLPIQRRIAGILSAYDDLIENSQRRIKILEEMARRLYREWFVHFHFPGHEDCTFVESPLGEIPEGWRIEPLGDIAQITMGLSPKGDSYNEEAMGTPLINGPVEYGERFPKRVKWTTSPTKTCSKGSLIICVRGSTTGKYVKSDGEYCLGRGVCSLSSGFQGFVDQLFISELPVLLRQAGGSTFPSWTSNQLLNHQVVSPSLAILTRFEEVSKPINEQISVIDKQIQNLRCTRDLLLPRLLSGQIDVEALPAPRLTEP